LKRRLTGQQEIERRLFVTRSHSAARAIRAQICARCQPTRSHSTAITPAENTALAIATGAEDTEHGACYMANVYAEATAELLRRLIVARPISR
jgi:hypothetical protein